MAVQVFIVRKVFKPIHELLNGVLKISDGYLTQKVTVLSKDELGQLCESFNKMANSLKSTIQQVSEMIDHLASLSEELSAGAD